MISINGLSKSIQGREILANITTQISEGECVALIGQNGAGKTSLISCLLGEMIPSQGTITMTVSPQELAVLPQENVIPTDLKVQELLNFFQSIYEDALSPAEIDRWLQFSQAQKQQLAGKLSGGQKRLLAFILILIGKPKLLFLDEPTAGMDTSTRQHFWTIIQELKAHGVTVFYTSHYLEEVETTADRILLLHQGQLVRDTSPFTIRNEQNDKQVTLAASWAPVVAQLTGISNLTHTRDTVQFQTAEIEQVWQELTQQGCRISDLQLQNQSLLASLFENQEGDQA
ncbi:ABC transporter ATP-binding protein [Streptococcus danieliae]|uniref:ABC transporter ATP-binding protein n=1 Tax=Streptococcus danieliae TaxID=747656 RepID=A0A7Z0LDQ9_9STRE|nr:ABC transporter ATP-binding protein [Streptococcus danieliae]MBF0717446.1 ABC transporter ATP-binding protein [Streptococcus danieliae]NYS49376.1 ABC transporter ATP-binding protein [Streptococcus danieliae]